MKFYLKKTCSAFGKATPNVKFVFLSIFQQYYFWGSLTVDKFSRSPLNLPRMDLSNFAIGKLTILLLQDLLR